MTPTASESNAAAWHRAQRDEWLDARNEQSHQPHPRDCTCRPCAEDER
jgi:hypothetical protein